MKTTINRVCYGAIFIISAEENRELPHYGIVLSTSEDESPISITGPEPSYLLCMAISPQGNLYGEDANAVCIAGHDGSQNIGHLFYVDEQAIIHYIEKFEYIANIDYEYLLLEDDIG